MSTPQERRSPHREGNEVCLGGQPQSITDTSVEGQRYRLLLELRHNSINTIDARRDLNIMMPAARVKELRERGHNIVTRLIDIRDDQGRPHSRVALYSLISGATP